MLRCGGVWCCVVMCCAVLTPARHTHQQGWTCSELASHGDTVHARIPYKFSRSQPARLPRLGGLAKRGQQGAEGALRRPRQERNGDESRCLHRADTGGSKRGEEERRELAQETAPVHRKRGRQLRIRPREARVVD